MNYQMIALYCGQRQWATRFATLALARKEAASHTKTEKRPNWTYIVADFYGNVL